MKKTTTTKATKTPSCCGGNCGCGNKTTDSSPAKLSSNHLKWISAVTEAIRTHDFMLASRTKLKELAAAITSENK